MGLFNKTNPYEKDALDLEAALRSQSQATDPKQLRPAPPVHAPAPPPAAVSTPPKTSYGIEDAIKLMRELPDNKKEMVITIVQKTLISAKVNVTTIIEDAARKIDRLEKRNEKIGQEIRELEEAILQRKSEMDKNARDVEETREVKISFESTHQPFMPNQKAG